MLDYPLNCAYKSFAGVYDLFMDNIEYNQWVKYLYSIWTRYNLKPNIIADIGCGTGSVTTLLAKDGYDLIGIDNSEDMLMIAKEKSLAMNLDILYLKQDMSKLELFGTVDCFLCLCDSINYLTEAKDVLQTFKLVNNYLNPGGLFIFDINTPFKYENHLADNIFAETDDNAAFIWDNNYDNEKKINEYLLSLFIKENNTGKYLRSDEVHYQRAYSVDEITELIELSGLRLLDAFDSCTFNKPKAVSERIYFIAEEKGKAID